MLDFQKICQKNGLKITPQRVVIYETIAPMNTHPSTEQVYKIVKNDLPNISYDTVNRTLMTFAEIGLIDRVEGIGEPRRYDPDLNSHHHIHCIKCHKVTDIQLKDFDNILIPKKLQKKYKICSKKVFLEGICEDCQ